MFELLNAWVLFLLSLTVPEWLILAGGVIEILGVLTVAADIRLTRREVRRYERRPVTVYAAGASVLPAAQASGVGVVEGGREPTLEQRMEVLEDRIGQVQGELEERTRQIDAQAREKIGQAVKLSEMAARDRFDAIDTLLRGVTRAGIRLRVLGVVLVLAGLGLGVVGSIRA
jgi:hypothetical protein